MLEVSDKEFLLNSMRYLDLAEIERIIINRANGKRFSLTINETVGRLPSEDEKREIELGMAEYERGEYVTLRPEESLDDLLARTGVCTE